MEEKCPHCKVLFAPWARARTAVLSRTFDGSEEDKIFQNQALELYRKAFDEGRNYAGAYLKHFLEESIAVSVYFDRRRTQDIPKVIDEDKTLKTPVTDDAKRYYEYGYALNLFEQESAETFLLHFRSREHFWKVFFPSAFVHVEAAENQEGQDMLKAKGLYLFEGDTKDPEKVKEWTAAVRHTKELQNITEKTRVV